VDALDHVLSWLAIPGKPSGWVFVIVRAPDVQPSNLLSSGGTESPSLLP
jgi:hypothetical protein